MKIIKNLLIINFLVLNYYQIAIAYCPKGSKEKITYSTSEKLVFCLLDGEKVGEEKIYDKKTNKLLIQQKYLDGNLEGLQQTYFPNGKLKSTGYYQDGEMSGKWTRYSENGRVTDKGYWIDNEPNGTWEFFDNKNQTLIKGEMQCGKKVGDWKTRKTSTQKFETKYYPTVICDLPDLDKFELSFLTLLQSKPSAKFFTVQIGWVPILYKLPFDIYLKSDLKVSFIKYKSQSMFPMLQAGLGLEYHLLPFTTSFQFGFQRWKDLGMIPLFGIDIGYKNIPFLEDFFTKIFVRYNYSSKANFKINQILLGTEFQLFVLF